MLTGKIVKGIAGFYYVLQTEPGFSISEEKSDKAAGVSGTVSGTGNQKIADGGTEAAGKPTAEADGGLHTGGISGDAGFTGGQLYACRAKGIFRKENRKPLVGDDVCFEITDPKDREGNITELLPRRNALIRPAVANIDQAVVIFACTQPEPNLNLLDRFLISMEQKGIPSVLVFNKTDLTDETMRNRLRSNYEKSGYPVCFVSAEKEEGLETLYDLLRGKTSTVAGPSGVGKSTLINLLSPQVQMETGEVSEKIGRGRHTTRHAQLIPLGGNTFIVDTPGFTSLSLDPFEKEELGSLFPEFAPHEQYCRFAGCSHITEPDCGVKEALENSEISPGRYESYREFYKEISERKRW